MGRKKRRPYCRNATTTPRVSAPRSHAEAAVGQDAGQRQHGDELDHRIEPAVGDDGVLVSVHVLAIDARRIPARLRRFAVEELQHRDAGDVLLQIRIDSWRWRRGCGGSFACTLRRKMTVTRITSGITPASDERQHGAQPEHDGHDEAQHQHVAREW